uniref:Uncharacterized protein n=1 Tax=Oryza meridionalis TaxID=40149 RepID=A0A0E0CS43_9ORYZ
MELLLLPSRGAATRPLHQPSSRRIAGVFTARPAAAASSSNVEVIDTTAAAAAATARGDVAKNRQEWRAAGGLGLGLNLSEDMRRGMMWRMLAPAAAAVAAEAAFLRVDAGVADEATVFGGEEGEFLRALIDADTRRSWSGRCWWRTRRSATSRGSGGGSATGSSRSSSRRRRCCGGGRRGAGAGEAALRAAAAVTGLDLQPPLWVAFLLFGLLLGVPYGVFSASFDPAAVRPHNIRHVVLRAAAAGDGHGYDHRNK